MRGFYRICRTYRATGRNGVGYGLVSFYAGPGVNDCFRSHLSRSRIRTLTIHRAVFGPKAVIR
jgi:hypothetical protein